MLHEVSTTRRTKLKCAYDMINKRTIKCVLKSFLMDVLYSHVNGLDNQIAYALKP